MGCQKIFWVVGKKTREGGVQCPPPHGERVNILWVHTRVYQSWAIFCLPLKPKIICRNTSQNRKLKQKVFWVCPKFFKSFFKNEWMNEVVYKCIFSPKQIFVLKQKRTKFCFFFVCIPKNAFLLSFICFETLWDEKKTFFSFNR